MKDIDEIRRENICKIEQEVGSAAILSNLVGMSYAQYINLRDGAKDSKTGKRRGMRKETARKFEKATKKPTGWLDIDHEKQPDVIYTSSGIATVIEVKEPQNGLWPMLDDFKLLLDEDQERICAEIKRLADIARAYRAKFGATTACNDRVAQALPPVPKQKAKQ